MNFKELNALAEEQTGKSLFTGALNVSIIGLRSPRKDDQVSDRFQDKIIFTWQQNEDEDSRIILEFPATTYAGLKYYNNPINKSGTACLMSGFHKHLWEVGRHRNYKALRQVSDARVLRDNNRDDKNNPEPEIQTGKYYINLHRANYKGNNKTVESYSAGCQVLLAHSFVFLSLMKELERIVNETGWDKYSYFLLDL